MKISVGDLTRGFTREKEINLNKSITDFEFAGQGILLISPVNLKGKITNDNGKLKLNGLLEFEIKVKCHRCLKDITRKLSLKFEEKFSNADSIDHECYHFMGNEIDLNEMLLDIIVTSMPMKILCDEGCKGLCCSCGTDLNIKECSCKNENYDPRFEKLLKFKKNNL